MRNMVILALSVSGLFFLCVKNSVAQSAQWLAVSHVAGAPSISEQEADAILAQASYLLRMRDSPGARNLMSR
jgi:hypothetical protein